MSFRNYIPVYACKITSFRKGEVGRGEKKCLSPSELGCTCGTRAADPSGWSSRAGRPAGTSGCGRNGPVSIQVNKLSG